jgi:pimeloyl-ACP methyl ester carboxylesterase
MLLLYIVIFLVILTFLFAFYFFRKAFRRPPVKDLTDQDALFSSEWFSYSPVLEPSLEWFQKQQWETVDLTASDGCPLQALWLPVKGARACLMLMHGYGALPQNLCVAARWAVKQGWSVLLPYQRAHGKSGGEYCTLGLLEAEDCRLWALRAEELCGPNGRLILLGSGMGAFAALHAISKSLPASVSAVISDGAYACPMEILRRVMKEEMRMRVFPLLQIVCLYARLSWKVGLASVNLRESLKENKDIPVLFIHGKKDMRVPFSWTEEMSKNCPSKKALYLSENAGHGAASLSDSEAYFKHLRQFVLPLISGANSSQMP